MLAAPLTYDDVSYRQSVVSPKLREQLTLCHLAPEKVLFLDIETTGLSHHYDEITVIGWSFGGRSSTIIKGQRPDRLIKDARDAAVLVTFNGIRFDERFLRREYPDVISPKYHIDLMYLCRRVGLVGGQKKIERNLGIEVRDDISDLDGAEAVILWHRYLRGDTSALKTLVRYNRADIAAMGAILDKLTDLFWTELDLFAEPTKLERWSAPKNMSELPRFQKPSRHLSKPPDFEDIFAKEVSVDVRIVGIDLTGSESRGSGWSLLKGNSATFKTLLTDEEILTRTIEASPDLVSIDSPLCLPAGRKSVEDSDPGRERFGIMRECERELKRRGVNVYPCLLPSMQQLTARGIRLAKGLREQGIPVIESYPGAAQDIMRIPRKGAGIEWLRLGLQEFGIVGNLDDASHDELDAVTSALVGTFHWFGLSEALGNAEEPPLIVPKLDGRTHPTIIGISGPIAAGKTTMAQALERMGFAYTRFSLVIDDELRARSEPLDREHRQRLGSEINRSGKQRWLAERTLDRVAGEERVVVDGLRFPEDYAFLAERAGANFHHVFIDADVNKRQSRYGARSGDGAFDDAASSEVEGRVGDMRSLADHIFVNDTMKAELARWLSELEFAAAGGVKCLSQSL